MSITRDDARKIVVDFLKAQVRHVGRELVLIDGNTIERDFGWVFFYQSKRYLDTGDLNDAVVGNAPVVVMRADGSVHETGTAYPAEHYLRAFEK